jgi:hypothetical protein
VPVGIVLATKAGRTMSPDKPRDLDVDKNSTGWTTESQVSVNLMVMIGLPSERRVKLDKAGRPVAFDTRRLDLH